MWIISFFPDFVAHLILSLGILLYLAASFLWMIPTLRLYKIPVQIVGGILICVGVYLEGGISYKDKIALEVSELKVKLAAAEVKSSEKNVEIVTKVVTDTKIIHAKGATIVKYIEKNADTINKGCIISPDVITAHNKAATLDFKPDVSSEIKPNELPKVILPPRTDKN